jgi:hypothetical protein
VIDAEVAMRQLPFYFAIGLLAAPAAAEPRTRTRGTTPTRRQGRRAPVHLAPLRSPGGQHLVEFRDGAVYLDGRSARPGGAGVELAAPPVWRSDGAALAWIERDADRLMLVVLATLDAGVSPLTWDLPATLADLHVYWAGRTRVVVGPSLLDPRASASWDE